MYIDQDVDRAHLGPDLATTVGGKIMHHLLVCVPISNNLPQNIRIVIIITIIPSSDTVGCKLAWQYIRTTPI